MKNLNLTDEEQKMESAQLLLPPPGGEVVDECLKTRLLSKPVWA